MRFSHTIQRITTCFVAMMAFSLKAEPLSPTQWYHINTPHVNLIFRGGMSQEAQRMANTLDYLYGPVSKSLGVSPTPISLILWNQIFVPNGVTGQVPRKVDFYTAPPQDYRYSGTNDFLDLLAVHEFRHVVQHAKLNQNFNRLLYWFGGRMALASLQSEIIVPSWFLEGDAVGIETALTKSGRGRIPYFLLLYKTNLLERGDFSYCKQVFGSLKHKVPNQYPVGYLLTTHLRRKYGADVIANILEATTRPRLFPAAIKKVTDKSLVQIYKDTNEELRDLWQRQLKDLRITPATTMTAREDETYTDYSYPHLDENGNIIVLKSGLGTAAQFVMLDESQREHPVFIPGAIHSGVNFSVSQGQIAWTTLVPHPRWPNQQYGVIQRYDITQKRLKTLTHRSRYCAAALSPDATKIATTESDEQYRHRLVILDATDGKVLHRLPNPENYFYVTPKWLANGRQVVAVKRYQQKATLTLVDTITGESQDLLPYSEENIGEPVPYRQYIFYNSAYNGIDNIYALELASRQRYQVTSRKYGAYNPTISADGRWIIFNDFTKDGMDVVKMPFSPQEWLSLEEVEDRDIHYYAPLVAQEDSGDLISNIPRKTYDVAPYQPWKHLLNIHSWTWPLTPQDPEDVEMSLGLMLQSDDLLKTSSLKAGYLYDIWEHIGEPFVELNYKGWYPIVSFRGSFRKYYLEGESSQMAMLTLGLPLTFKQGQYTNTISLTTASSVERIAQTNIFEQIYQGRVIRQAKRSPRDLYSPWKQQLTVTYKHRPYWMYGHPSFPRTSVETLTIQPAFRFPSLFNHHFFFLSPRYIRESFPKILAIEHLRLPIKGEPENSYHVKLGYDCPLLYPDWSVGEKLYMKQLTANLFYETGYLPAQQIKYRYQIGIGASVNVGFSFLSIPLKVKAIVVYDTTRGLRFIRPTFSFTSL